MPPDLTGDGECHGRDLRLGADPLAVAQQREARAGLGPAEDQLLAVAGHHPLAPALGMQLEFMHRQGIEELIGHQQQRAFGDLGEAPMPLRTMG